MGAGLPVEELRSGAEGKSFSRRWTPRRSGEYLPSSALNSLCSGQSQRCGAPTAHAYQSVHSLIVSAIGLNGGEQHI